MDSFEAVVSAILQRQGHWTQTSVKVELTKAEKVKIKRPSTPRWELDVVGYRGSSNELIVMECKSYLDSTGVSCDVFAGKKPNNEGRYKLFFDDELRRVVLARLVRQFTNAGLCGTDPTVVFGLAAGKVSGSEEWLQSFFARKSWRFLGPRQIRKELQDLGDCGYENTVAAVVAKLLLRGNGAAAV